MLGQCAARTNAASVTSKIPRRSTARVSAVSQTAIQQALKKCRRPVKNGPTNRRPVVESDVLVFRAENVPLEQLS